MQKVFCKIAWLYHLPYSRFKRSASLQIASTAFKTVNIVCDGSPSLMRKVRLISFGMTTRPSSSILLTMPVARIKNASDTLKLLHDVCVVCTNRGVLCVFADFAGLQAFMLSFSAGLVATVKRVSGHPNANSL